VLIDVSQAFPLLVIVRFLTRCFGCNEVLPTTTSWTRATKDYRPTPTLLQEELLTAQRCGLAPWSNRRSRGARHL